MALVRAETNIEYLATTIDPRQARAGPPPTADSPAIMQTADIELQFDVTLITPTWSVLGPTSSEGVQNEEGLVLWFPQLGSQALYRFGIVHGRPDGSRFVGTKGYAALPTSECRGLNGIFNIGPGDSNDYGITQSFETRFVWLADVAIPYNQTGGAINVQSLARNFGETKLFAGICDVYSEGVPIGNTAFTGTISATSVADTRQISANRTGAQVTCFAIQDMMSMCVTQKDKVKLESVGNGVTCVVGSDMEKKFSAPDQTITDHIDADFKQYALSKFNSRLDVQYNGALFPAPASAYFRNGLPLAQAWITPWDTQYAQAIGCGATLPADLTTLRAYNIIRTDPIDETGVLDIGIAAGIVVSYNIPGAPSTDPYALPAFTLRADVTHIFASINVNGTVQYFNVTERKDIQRQDYGSAYLEDGGAAIRGSFGFPRGVIWFEPRVLRESMTNQGKYMGSFVNLYVTCDTFMDTSIIQSINCNIPPQVLVRARGINRDGRKGPCRVIRWDNVSPGQSVIIRGQNVVVGIPTGQAAPLLQSNSNGRAASDLQMESLISLLYNGPSPIFKRVWVTREYRTVIEEAIRKGGTGAIQAFLQRQESTAASGQAAGVLGDILGSVGHVVGSIGDAVLGGAAGQFGASAGQFGAAAGQFGAASGYGQFGASAGGPLSLQRRARLEWDGRT